MPFTTVPCQKSRIVSKWDRERRKKSKNHAFSAAFQVMGGYGRRWGTGNVTMLQSDSPPPERISPIRGVAGACVGYWSVTPTSNCTAAKRKT